MTKIIECHGLVLIKSEFFCSVVVFIGPNYCWRWNRRLAFACEPCLIDGFLLDPSRKADQSFLCLTIAGVEPKENEKRLSLENKRKKKRIYEASRKDRTHSSDFSSMLAFFPFSRLSSCSFLLQSSRISVIHSFSCVTSRCMYSTDTKICAHFYSTAWAVLFPSLSYLEWRQRMSAFKYFTSSEQTMSKILLFLSRFLHYLISSARQPLFLLHLFFLENNIPWWVQDTVPLFLRFSRVDIIQACPNEGKKGWLTRTWVFEMTITSSVLSRQGKNWLIFSHSTVDFTSFAFFRLSLSFFFYVLMFKTLWMTSIRQKIQLLILVLLMTWLLTSGKW